MPVPSLKTARSTTARHRLPVRPPFSRRARRGAGSAPVISDPALRHWLGAFHQLHTESDTYTPVALRLMPTSGPVVASSSADGSEAPPATARYVYEVAHVRDATGERWVLVLWEVDVPGIQFCDCADRDEAMALFAEPAKAAERWHGVRLRPESRPW